MTDGQCLTFGPEQHLLMRDQTAQPDAMHPDPVDLGPSSTRKLLDRCVRWQGEGSRGALPIARQVLAATLGVQP